MGTCVCCAHPRALPTASLVLCEIALLSPKMSARLHGLLYMRVHSLLASNLTRHPALSQLAPPSLRGPPGSLVPPSSLAPPSALAPPSSLRGPPGALAQPSSLAPPASAVAPPPPVQLPVKGPAPPSSAPPPPVPVKGPAPPSSAPPPPAKPPPAKGPPPPPPKPAAPSKPAGRAMSRSHSLGYLCESWCLRHAHTSGCASHRVPHRIVHSPRERTLRRFQCACWLSCGVHFMMYSLHTSPPLDLNALSVFSYVSQLGPSQSSTITIARQHRHSLHICSRRCPWTVVLTVLGGV
jgi:hypothetical protein